MYRPKTPNSHCWPTATNLGLVGDLKASRRVLQKQPNLLNFEIIAMATTLSETRFMCYKIEILIKSTPDDQPEEIPSAQTGSN